VKRVIILGVNHRGRGHRAALSPWDSWRTPLGDLLVDQEFNAYLEARLGFLTRDPRPHLEEHSIEIQLPFLQRWIENPKIVPISLWQISPQECAKLGQAIAEILRLETVNKLRTVIIASSDLSHYLSPQQTDELDRLAVDQVLALDPAGLLRVTADKNITMCGVIPTAAMLFAAMALGVKRTVLLKHCHSGDITPMRQVVGYASVALAV
jgi:AmmeMemoRadiSam system protein B